jgi:hypothetical protein
MQRFDKTNMATPASSTGIHNSTERAAPDGLQMLHDQPAALKQPMQLCIQIQQRL